MTNLEKLEANERKQQLIEDLNYTCQVCNKQFTGDKLQLAHRIPKGQVKYHSKEIIHHRFNMILTCSDCNSSVLKNKGARPKEVEALIEKIKQDLGE
ncbi:MAG: HNH endonuclease [Colwellia sp.]|nr:HNH endonuclease [Colwellia sp.]